MGGEPFDPIRILAGLRSHGVNYILIGGLAAAAHGSPIETDDVDVCLAADDQNLDRFGLALLDLGANPVPDDGGDDDRVSFMTSAGRLDCLELGGRYSELAWNAKDIDLGRGVVAPRRLRFVLLLIIASALLAPFARRRRSLNASG